MNGGYSIFSRLCRDEKVETISPLMVKAVVMEDIISIECGCLEVKLIMRGVFPDQNLKTQP